MRRRDRPTDEGWRAMSTGPITAFALTGNSAAIADPRNTSVSILTSTSHTLVCGREQVEALLLACRVALGEQELER